MRAVLLLLALAGAVSTAQWHRNGNNDLPNNWNVNRDTLNAHSIMMPFTEGLKSPNKTVALRYLNYYCKYMDCDFNKKDCDDFVSKDLASKMVYDIDSARETGGILHINVILSAANPKTDPTKWFLMFWCQDDVITGISHFGC
ncbi:hypothetical protein CAEBREN_21439 [Caenorhabditis brenneri]|uniref:Uncharacterized protein n=1 Tax=Caenorhabditis brenneri TaxID=135651 RepID=G0M6W9_CAEBE|nr:hypothetical protein CAEBREN_21439 [Caenorhabditis brenneri]